MIILDSTLKSLEVILAGAITTNQLPWTAHYVEVKTSDKSVNAIASNDGQTNSASSVTMVSAPSSGFTRTIKSITVQNADSVAATVTIRLNNNGTFRVLYKATLASGENLNYEGS